MGGSGRGRCRRLRPRLGGAYAGALVVGLSTWGVRGAGEPLAGLGSLGPLGCGWLLTPARRRGAARLGLRRRPRLTGGPPHTHCFWAGWRLGVVLGRGWLRRHSIWWGAGLVGRTLGILTSPQRNLYICVGSPIAGSLPRVRIPEDPSVDETRARPMGDNQKTHGDSVCPQWPCPLEIAGATFLGIWENHHGTGSLNARLGAGAPRIDSHGDPAARSKLKMVRGGGDHP